MKKDPIKKLAEEMGLSSVERSLYLEPLSDRTIREDVVIVKRYLDKPDEWIETTIQECIEHTVGAGYYAGEWGVKCALMANMPVKTPFAEWRMIKAEEWKK